MTIITTNRSNTVRSNSTNSTRSNRQLRQATSQTMPGSNLTYIRGGNILEDDAQTVLVGCNTQGDMRLGLAGQIAKKYLEVVGAYKAACQSDDGFLPGAARRARTKNPNQQVILMAIWKLQEFAPKMEWINSALCKFYNAVGSRKIEITSVACVKLGCFNAETSLKWEEVGPLMAGWLGALGVPVRIYIGADDPCFFRAEGENGKIIINRVEASATPNYDENDAL